MKTNKNGSFRIVTHNSKIIIVFILVFVFKTNAEHHVFL